jgi:hypothetical protein
MRLAGKVALNDAAYVSGIIVFVDGGWVLQ